ncbi:MAG: DUF1611 domain-containing protein [Armatimonadetes bacterium]|nr:DUF1611 domain-containing protein [Armatimonadota bacterium]
MAENLTREVRFSRIAILAEKAFDIESGKTAVGLIRYGRCRTVAIIDSRTAGKTAADVIGIGQDVPIVAALKDALQHSPETLVIGIAPRGGSLPEEWRSIILEAIAAGLDVVSGLHTFLNDDPEISAAAKRRRVILWDARRPPQDIQVAEGVAPRLDRNIVLTVGTDCCVGKMSVSLELTTSARSRGLSADFVPTGQTGIMLWGRGIAIDAVVADFIAGATEQMVLDAAKRAQWVFVEGQGSLYHPGYSGVTMGLIHGSGPSQLVLCHKADRPEIRSYGVVIPPLSEVVAYYEAVCRPLFPTRVSAIALNTHGLTPTKCARAIAQAEDTTGLPADDCVRNGADKLLSALLENSPDR